MSIVTDRPRDCLSCRLVGGFGLVGIGTYLGVISRKNKPLNTQAAKTTVAIIACGFIALGAARILNLSPFNNFGSKTKGVKNV